MCSLCTVKRFKNGGNEVYIIDEDETMNGTDNNGNIPASVVMTTGGPPTMVQLQRTSQPRPGLLFSFFSI